MSHVHSFFFKRGPEAVTPYACFAPKKMKEQGKLSLDASATDLLGLCSQHCF
ncbi:hypothetical protein PRUPE_8G035000 [Prunus persica]|uniref:Uncharacterized protein n=1 Tax=Prunus persica TaxID=3760 RepID=A0A251MVM9_PRUPE|nr:hypothetical protein PRUPE_8G035000 [Prunus persica]